MYLRILRSSLRFLLCGVDGSKEERSGVLRSGTDLIGSDPIGTGEVREGDINKDGVNAKGKGDDHETNKDETNATDDRQSTVLGSGKAEWWKQVACLVGAQAILILLWMQSGWIGPNFKNCGKVLTGRWRVQP